jgi:predicted Zn-dependent protease
MSTTEIKLYDIFRNDLKLSDAKAKLFAEVVQETIQNEVKHEQTEFKSILKEDFYKIDIKIEQMNAKIEGVRGEIKDSKADMIKRMFAFWVTIILMLLANFFLKK